jgi:hypothetical protein
MKERVLNRLLRRRAVRENGSLIGRWMLRTANPFKNCEISSDGSLVVFWTDRELTLFTSLSLTNGDVEARPQDQWSLEREDSNWFWKNIRLTNRYLLASTSGGTFQVKGPQYSSWQDPLANVVWAEVLCFRFEEGRIGGCQLCPSEAILLKTTRDS